MIKKILIGLIPLVFKFLKSKALLIAHAQLRQNVQKIIDDAEATATLLIERDLTDADTAYAVYHEQQPFFKVPVTPIDVLQNRTFMETLGASNVPTDVPPVFNDLPSLRKRTPRAKAQ
jgi:hypothetical protein